jgi:hypothetical protein
MNRLGLIAAGWVFVSLSLVAAEKPAEGWVKLFDGKSLTGWKANEVVESFSVKDGAIVAHGQPRSHLYYVGDEKPFVNFELELEIMTKPMANSGVFFHAQWQETDWPKTGVEVQVNNTHRDPIKTGSLYRIKNIEIAPAQDDKWFTMNIRVEGKNVVVKVDNKVVNEYTEPETSNKIDKGTFCLQAHDPKSIVMYRSIKVKRLP